MAGPGSAARDSRSPRGSQILHPLSEFYVRAGWELPVVERIAVAVVPEPAARVLAHEREMTARLEQHLGAPIGLRVLSRVRHGAIYARQVLLTRTDDERPLALAAAEVRLDALPGALVGDILAEREPLGRILRSRPELIRVHHGHFRLSPDDYMRRLLQLRATDDQIYGRSGTLVDATGHTIANVVEIVASSVAA